MRHGLLCALAALICVVPAFAAQSHGREITDMFGKTVSVSDRPRKVYSTSPPVTYMLYALDPSMPAGLNFPIREQNKKYFRKSIQQLPVLGGWYGQGETPNLEMIMKAAPEIVVVSKHNSAMDDKIDGAVKTISIPAINVTLNTLSDYPEAFLHLGRALGREARGEELAVYARETLSQISALVNTIPVRDRLSVYYAEGADGLSTECDNSLHSEVINFVGGHNVHRCRSKNFFGMEKITLEQVILYNPDVMLVKEPVFFKNVFSDHRWRQLKAVKEKRIYMIPNEPFNWFDRPPSFMRLLGAKWLANLLYPNSYRVDMTQETQAFFKLFLDVNLNEKEAKALLRR